MRSTESRHIPSATTLAATEQSLPSQFIIHQSPLTKANSRYVRVRVVTNTMNRQPQTSDKEWSSSFGVEPHDLSNAALDIGNDTSLKRRAGRCGLSSTGSAKGWRTVVSTVMNFQWRRIRFVWQLGLTAPGRYRKNVPRKHTSIYQTARCHNTHHILNLQYHKNLNLR